ncbi:MAG: universal stress protein [Desulfarculaceae bacterium]|nr:universal stress protein [Desulfarculaceae bacterium]
MLKNILFPIKKNEKTGRVLEMARFLKIFDTEKIILLHVGKNNGKERLINLKRIKEALENESYTTELIFRQGHVPARIVRAGIETEASFICLPWKEKNPIRRAIMGNVASDVIRLSNQPVLVYKTAKGFSAANEVNTVLYATGLMSTDIKILNYLTYRGFKAQNLILLHVGERAPDPVAEEDRIKRVHNSMSGIEEKCTLSFEHIEKIEAVAGSVSTQIARKASRKGAGLIIIGKVDKQRPFEKITGSVAESLPEKANCPVLIIPGGYRGIEEKPEEEKTNEKS